MPGERRQRFIPAWAGQPGALHPRPICGGVHPRVGGAALAERMLAIRSLGSSPRGRGSLSARAPRQYRMGFIPAWAGQPATLRLGRLVRWVHPRVGGAARIESAQRVLGGGSSPRGRGSPLESWSWSCFFRFIPAWAGQPFLCFHVRFLFLVHPRVGGAATLASLARALLAGSSPRGRGSQYPVRISMHEWGFIPAWAGQPVR